jgi:hypothetical protein
MDANQITQMMGRLRAMDTNGNGILEPSEISNDRRPMVEGMVTRLGGNPGGSINLANLERRAMANVNSNNANNAQQRPNQPQQQQQAAGQQRQPTVEPLVQPFGETRTAETPALGFGQRSTAQTTQGGRGSGGAAGRQQREVTAAQANQQAARNANTVKQSDAYDNISAEVRNNPQFRWFFDYDTDRDGQLSMTEYVNGLGGVWTEHIAGEFQNLDRNGDGFITMDEALATIKEWDEQRAAQEAKERQAAGQSVNTQPGQPMPGRPTGTASPPSVRTPGSSQGQGYQGRPPSSTRDSQGSPPSREGRGGSSQGSRRGG